MQFSAEQYQQRPHESRRLTRLFWTLVALGALSIGCDSTEEGRSHRMPTSFGGLVSLVQEAQEAGQASGVRVGSLETESGITVTVLWFNSQAATVFNEFKLVPVTSSSADDCNLAADQRAFKSNARRIVVVDNTQTADSIGNPGAGQPDYSDMYAFGVCVSELSR